MCDTLTPGITRKSLLTLYHFELAWMEHSEAGINVHTLFYNSVIYLFGLGFSLPQPISDCVSCLVTHKICWYKITKFINVLVHSILKSLLKLPFLQVSMCDWQIHIVYFLNSALVFCIL